MMRNFKAFVDGKMIPIEQVSDQVFSEKNLGDGISIVPTNNMLVSPCDGIIHIMLPKSGNVCGIESANGMRILIHVGINTSLLGHDGFYELVSEKICERRNTPYSF